jgi:hypothetical protein
VPPAVAIAMMLAGLKGVPPVPTVSSVPPAGGSESAMSTSAADAHPAAPEKTS